MDHLKLVVQTLKVMRKYRQMVFAQLFCFVKETEG